MTSPKGKGKKKDEAEEDQDEAEKDPCEAEEDLEEPQPKKQKEESMGERQISSSSDCMIMNPTAEEAARIAAEIAKDAPEPEEEEPVVEQPQIIDLTDD